MPDVLERILTTPIVQRATERFETCQNIDPSRQQAAGFRAAKYGAQNVSL
jgi:hypothetical protein